MIPSADEYTDIWTEEELREAGNELFRRLDQVDPYDSPASEQQEAERRDNSSAG